jgi:hypothetical protein
MSDAAEIRITHPRNGDVLNRHDGIEVAGALTIEVSGTAPEGVPVKVNGLPAHVSGGRFRCELDLTQRRTAITAFASREGADLEHTATVLWDKASRPRYRFSVDDNIEFLRELALRADDYASLFDHWYLGFWRQMHEEFGAKIHINIYYQTVGGEFTLRQMPDKWKDEWAANSDWLHLTFHALQDQPERIYKDATYDQMAADFDLVVGEIERFAGRSVLSKATTIHWAEAPLEACRALRDRGIRVLVAIFRREFDGECPTGYYLSTETKDYANTRDAYYDPEADLIFVSEDATVNNLALDEIEPWLDRQQESPHTSELMELLIHEQYFRRERREHDPDIREKVVRSLKWVTERGYEPVFWGDGFLGNRTLP